MSVLGLLDRVWATDGWTAEWDQIDPSQRRWEYEAALALSDPRPGQLCLDVGGGTGFLAGLLTEAGIEAVHIDRSNRYDQARRPAHIVIGDAGDPDIYADMAGPIDRIYSISVIEHIEPRQRLAGWFALWAAVLAPGGLLAVTTELAIVDPIPKPSSLLPAEMVEHIEAPAAGAGLGLLARADCPFHGDRRSVGKWLPRLWVWRKPL